MTNKQIPALPQLDEAPADDDRFVVRDTSSGSDKSLRVDRFLERSADQVAAHSDEQGGIHGIPEDERALHTADIGTATGEVIGTDEAREYFGLDYETSVLPTISSDFERNRHELYEQYGNEPKTILQMWTTARDTDGTYRDASGVIRTASPAEPRIDYDPVTGRAALLVEEARTNLLLNSETLSTQDVAVTNVAHTLHFTGTGTVTLSGAAAGELVGTGDGEINRVALTFTPSEGTLTLTVSGSVTFSQLEAASTPSSYIPTEASQATRAADLPSRNLGDEFNPREGTLFIDFSLATLDTNAFGRLVEVSNFDGSERILLDTDDQGRTRLLITSGGSTSPTSRVSLGAASNRVAFSWGEGISRWALNGDAQTSISGSPVITPDAVFALLASRTGSLLNSGAVSASKYIPRALSDTELQEMTKL